MASPRKSVLPGNKEKCSSQKIICQTKDLNYLTSSVVVVVVVVGVIGAQHPVTAKRQAPCFNN